MPDEVLPAAAFSAQLAEQVFEEEAEEADLRPGDDVEHRVFGEGVIQKVLGTGVNQRLVVEFENGSERTLLAAYSMLEKVT